MERQTDDGQSVLCLVWDYPSVSRRGSGITFYEATQRAEYLTPARTASHDATGSGGRICYGGGNESELRAQSELGGSAALVCAYAAPGFQVQPGVSSLRFESSLCRSAFML